MKIDNEIKRLKELGSSCIPVKVKNISIFSLYSVVFPLSFRQLSFVKKTHLSTELNVIQHLILTKLSRY